MKQHIEGGALVNSGICRIGHFFSNRRNAGSIILRVLLLLTGKGGPSATGAKVSGKWKAVLLLVLLGSFSAREQASAQAVASVSRNDGSTLQLYDPVSLSSTTATLRSLYVAYNSGTLTQRAMMIAKVSDVANGEDVILSATGVTQRLFGSGAGAGLNWDLTGLQPNTTYWLRAMQAGTGASGNIYTLYSKPVKFTTPAINNLTDITRAYINQNGKYKYVDFYVNFTGIVSGLTAANFRAFNPVNASPVTAPAITNVAIDEANRYRWKVTVLTNNNNQVNLEFKNITGTNYTTTVRTLPYSNASSYYIIESGSAGLNQLYTWGRNAGGSLGEGSPVTTLERSTPNLIQSNQYWSSLSGASHFMAIKSDGTLWGWGVNSTGRIGINNDVNQIAPAQVGNTWAVVCAGGEFSLGITQTGELYTWGGNNHGQLGNGAMGAGTAAYYPIRPVGTAGYKWKHVAATYTSGFAVREDGSLWFWGYTNNQSFYPSGGFLTTPVRIGGDSNWEKVYTYGTTYSGVVFGYKTDGSVWAWGNNSGMFGNGTTAKNATPVQLQFRWKNILPSSAGILGITEDGKLYGWGYNSSGVLGNGTNTGGNFINPQQIGSDSNWDKVASSSNGSYFAIKQDGSLWAWGNNTNGCLGIGTTTATYVPTRVETPTPLYWVDVSNISGTTAGLARVAATVTPHTMSSNNSNPNYAVTGNILTLWFATNGVSSPPEVDIAGGAATVTAVSGTTEWKAVYTLTGAEIPGSTIPYTIDYTDIGGISNSKNYTYSGITIESDASLTSVATQFNPSGDYQYVDFQLVFDKAITGINAANFGFNYTGGSAPTYSYAWQSGNNWFVRARVNGNTRVGLKMLNSNGLSIPVGNLPYYNAAADYYIVKAPVITSFSPETGEPGTAVTINGNYFNTANKDNNIVWFGATRAAVQSASATQLVVTAPAGADYRNISVHDKVSNLSGVSAKPFITTRTKPQMLFGRQEYTVMGKPLSTLTRDFNGDGKPDVAIMWENNPGITVYKNNTTAGTPISAANFSEVYWDNVGANVTAVATGDIDGDGLQDMVVTRADGNVTVLRNTSTASVFSFAKTNIAVDADPVGIALADLNEDGRLDIITGHNSSNKVDYLLNRSTTGNINFLFGGSADLPSGAYARYVAAEDLNGDGKADIVVANMVGPDPTISVFRNTGEYGVAYFTTAERFNMVSVGLPRGLKIADLDGDGKKDILVTSEAMGFLSIYRNVINQTGSNIIMSAASFARTDIAAQSASRSVAIGDLDGDGKVDLAVANWGANSVTVFRSTNVVAGQPITSASFTRTIITPPNAYTPTEIDATDLNGDNTADLILTNYNQHMVGTNAGNWMILPNDLPVPPANFTAASGNTFIDLDWNAPALTGVTGYKIYYGTDNTTPTLLTTITNPATLTYKHEGLAEGTYYYRISAVYTGDLESDLSAAVNATTDTTIPTLTISGASLTNASGTNLTFDFSEPVKNFDATDITVSGGTAASFTKVNDQKYTIALSYTTGSQQATVSVAAGAYADLKDNANTAVASKVISKIAVGIDATSIDEHLPASSLAGTLSSSPNPENIPVIFTLVTGSGAEDNSYFNIANGVELRSAVSFNYSDPLHVPSYNIRVRATGATPDVYTEKALTITINDRTAPVTNAIEIKNAVNTNASSLIYKVTFSEPVVGVNAASFNPVTVSGALTTGVITVNPLSSTVYEVTVSDVDGDGELRLDLKTAGTGITDLAGNAINGGYTTGGTYSVDQTLPVITDIEITSANTNPSAAKTGDKITLNFNTSETVAIPLITIAGKTVSQITNTGGNAWKAEYILDGSENEGFIGYSINVTDGAQNGAANSSASTIIYDRSKPLRPQTGTVSGLNAAGYTQDNTPTLGGTAEANSKLKIFVNAAEQTEVSADGSGNWTYTFPSDLTDGSYEITVISFDSAGNESLLSEPLPFIIDTQHPSSAFQSNVLPNGYTNDNTPTYNGTTEPGAKIVVVVGGTTYGPVTADVDGKWQITISPALSDNSYEVKVIVTDRSGNSSESTPSVIVVDTADPAIPAQLTIPANGESNDNTPTYNGVTEPGATVTVVIDGANYGPVTAGSDGRWEITIEPALNDSSHELKVIVTDKAGNSSESLPVTLIIDTQNPPSASQTTVLPNGYTNDNTPTWNGLTEPGARVILVVGGTSYGPVTAGADGKWEITVSPALTDGDYDVKVVVTDKAGNIGESVSVSITVDTQNPPAASQSNVLSNGYTNDNTPTYTGLTEPGATITVRIDGVNYGPVTADPDGKWQVTINPALIDGSYEVKVVVADLAGNIGESAPLTIIVDTVNPAVPAQLLIPANGESNDNTPVYSGITEAGATVVLVIDGADYGPVTAGPDGHWEITVSPALTDDTHELKIVVSDKAGNTSESLPVTLLIDTQDPSAAYQNNVQPNGYTSDNTPAYKGQTEPGATVVLVVDGNNYGPVVAASDGKWNITVSPALIEGPHEVKVAVTDKAGNTAESLPVTIIVDTVSPAIPASPGIPASGISNDNTPTYAGTVEPGAAVKVVIDGIPYGPVTAGPDGHWEITIGPALPDGPHDVKIVVTDAAGNSSESSAVTIIIDTVQPAVPAAPQLPANGSSNDNTPTYNGITEPGATVVVMIDGVPYGPVTAGADGHWEITISPALNDGPHEVKVVVTDKAGNSSESPVVTVIIDTVKPAAPAAPVLPGNGHSNTSMPTVTGKTEPGATAEIWVNGAKVGEALADENGNWTYTFNPPLTDGSYQISIIIIDRAGNRSEGSSPVTLTIDTVKPARPGIPVVEGGVSTGNGSVLVTTATPAINGNAEPGATVEIWVDGHKYGEVIANENGNWHYTFNPALSDGLHEITVVVRDAAGNLSEGEKISLEVITKKTTTVMTFGQWAGKSFGDADFSAALNSNSPAQVIYSSSNTNVATIDAAGRIHITGAGTTQITASQEAGRGFTASSISAELQIAKAKQQISFARVPRMDRFGRSQQLDARATSGLPLTVSSFNPLVVKTDGVTLKPQGIGRAVLLVKQAGNENYQSEEIKIEIQVSDPAGNEIIVSKLVSPNGDGINDLLQIEGLTNFKSHRLVIVNRNGTKVFDTRQYDTGDTSYNPADHPESLGVKTFKGYSFQLDFLPSGSYFYILEYSTESEVKHKTGYFLMK